MSPDELKLKTELIFSQVDFKGINALLGTREFDKYCSAATYPPLKSLSSDFSADAIFSVNKKLTDHPVNIYIHFPFCAQLCSFCHFNVVVNRNPNTYSQYVDHLLSEIHMYKEVIEQNSVESIMIGGGTPSLMSITDIKRVLESIHQINPKSKDVPVIFEIHPKTVLKENRYLNELKALGIKRISIGVQDFDEKILKAINRGHDQNEAIEIIEYAKSVGMYTNIDLMTPLPLQTFDSWITTLQILMKLAPEQVTLNITAIRDSMRIYKEFQENHFPSVADCFRFNIAAQVFLTAHGYDEVSPLKFRKRDATTNEKLKLNKKNYFSHTTLAFGAGAYSTYPTHFYYNYPKVKDYQDKIVEKKLPFFMSIDVDPTESLHREMVFFVRKGKIDLSKLKDYYNVDVEEYFKGQLKFLLTHGLVAINKNILSTTFLGNLFRDEISKLFVSESIVTKIKENLEPSKTVKHLNHFYEF